MAKDECFKGVIFGSLVGAALGILYAPRSGKETRNQICSKSEELMKKAREQYEDLIRTIERLAEKEKEMLAEQKCRLKNALEAGVDAYKQEKQ